MPFKQYTMAVINGCCIVLNNKLEPLDRWHILAVMSVSFTCLISMLWISVLLLPCPWEIVLCWRKPVEEGDGEKFLWGCNESNQTVALRTLTFLLSLVFRYVRWKRFKFFINGMCCYWEVFSLIKVFFAGRYLLRIPVMSVFFCVSRCTR